MDHSLQPRQLVQRLEISVSHGPDCRSPSIVDLDYWWQWNLCRTPLCDSSSVNENHPSWCCLDSSAITLKWTSLESKPFVSAVLVWIMKLKSRENMAWRRIFCPRLEDYLLALSAPYLHGPLWPTSVFVSAEPDPTSHREWDFVDSAASDLTGFCSCNPLDCSRSWDTHLGTYVRNLCT